MPSDARTWKLASLITAGVVLLMCTAALLGYLVGRSPDIKLPDDTAKSAVTQVETTTDATAFVRAITGSWQSEDEQLVISTDKGVFEILRQSLLETGEVRLDQYVAAPVRVELSQQLLELESPDGIWVLNLIPGERRAHLKITYPDKRHVQYE